MVPNVSGQGTYYVPPLDYIHLNVLSATAEWAPFVIAALLLVLMHRRLTSRRQESIPVADAIRGPWDERRRTYR